MTDEVVITKERAPRRRRTLVYVVLTLGVAAVLWLAPWRSGRPYTPPALAFEGSSSELARTTIVPTLDTPMPAGQNVIWCASFQLAWNRLKDDVVKEPVDVANASEVAQRLNSAGVSESDLPPDSCYAAAGLVADGTIEKIRREMAARFPGRPAPDLDATAAIVAYAYLQAAAAFTIPYFDNDAEFLFNDSTDKQTAVTSFGVRPEDEYAYYKLRKQPEILYAKIPTSPGGAYVGGHIAYDEFVLDLCKTAEPCQIVVAVVPPLETLAATLAYVDENVAAWSPEYKPEFGPRDVLLVPNMFWKITHHFQELEGLDKNLLNAGYEKLWIETALQSIEFKLDRSGAELASQTKWHVRPIPTHYVFDCPFLLYMKKRGAEYPFLVMWIDNAELLSKP